MVDKKSDSYLFQKRGVWYFSRHSPVDVRGHYRCKRLVRSLRTKSFSKASKTALVWSDHLESVWSGIRLRHLGLGPSFEEVTLSSSNVPTLSKALETYLKLKGHGRAAHYEAAARRAVDYAVEAIGDKPIDAYTQLDASRFRDALFSRSLSSSSVKRMFSAVKAIMQLSIAEYGLTCPNVFRGTFLPKKDDVRKRQPILIDTIRSVQNECQTIDDDLRWLIALLSDSGLRLAEAVGLLITDIRIDTDIPHVVIQQHDWRPLKTASSTRTVPLVGMSLWAAHRIVKNSNEPYAFSRYNDGIRANSNHASAALNKWLRTRVPKDCVIHSFRHSMRDRLRAVQCPFDIVDRIGGWTTAGIGHSYGAGYDLPVLNEWMMKITELDL
jgi:integrase